jgi:3-hydroxymyristoyl/3-hydroxydecanoyl-(acyl carrier protein) dehydratase
MFRFDDISRSRAGDTLAGSCVVTANMPFFNGHFPGTPIMPAVAQIEMIQSLLQQHGNWNGAIVGGTGLKFARPIRPGDLLTIRLRRAPSGAISFVVEDHGGVASKGILQPVGGPLG